MVDPNGYALAASGTQLNLVSPAGVSVSKFDNSAVSSGQFSPDYDNMTIGDIIADILANFATGFTGRRSIGLGPYKVSDMRDYIRAVLAMLRGETPEIVLQRAEALGAKLDGLNGTANKVGSYQSVAQFVPSVKQQNADRALLAQHVFDDPAALRATLLRAGFKDEVADAWLAAYAKPQQPLTVETWLAAPWSQPYRHLWLGEVDPASKAYASVVIPQGVTPQNEPALIATAQALPGVVFVDKAASVSKLFGAYRVDSGWWLGGALALVLILLMLRYRARGGIAVTLPVLLAVVVGVLFGLPVLGVRGDYLAVATMGLGEIVRVIVQ